MAGTAAATIVEVRHAKLTVEYIVCGITYTYTADIIFISL
jgi:hypothetical protein